MTYEAKPISPFIKGETGWDIAAKHTMGVDIPSKLGVVGDKGPEGEQGPPGHVEDEESTSPKIKLPEVMNKGITLQDIIGSKKVAATETGGVVLMPQEFDADNVKAYIQQEIEAGIEEHQTALMRKFADVLAEEITKVKNIAKQNYDKAVCTIANLENVVNRHRKEAEEFDQERALDIAKLELKVAELEDRLEEKSQEAKILRSKLHAVSISKPVRKVKRRKYDSQGQDTPKPGAGG